MSHKHMTTQNDQELNEIQNKQEEVLINKINDNYTETNQEYTNHQRGFAERYFSKLNPGSLRGSIFNLSIVSIGIGALTLPAAYGNLGVFASVIFTVFFAITSYWTLSMIVFAGRKSNLVVYGKVCEHYLGKWGSYLYDITNIIYIFGILIVYQIISKWLLII